MKTLPIIDYQAPAAAADFAASLRVYGFAALRNHPLDMQLVQRIYDDWLAFFSTPAKHDFQNHSGTLDGYFSTQNAESAKGYDQRDFKEYFHFYRHGCCPEHLKADLLAYYAAALTFGARLLGWIEAEAPKAVRQCFSEPLSSMISGSKLTLLRVLHYPPVATADALRAAPHEDINLLTILPAAEGAGLEIKKQDGSWLPVAPDPTTVVVNIGDMLQEASAGYYPSTTHQVVVPASPEQRRQSRLALPLFLQPRPEVVLSERHTADSYFTERLRELGVIQP